MKTFLLIGSAIFTMLFLVACGSAVVVDYILKNPDTDINYIMLILRYIIVPSSIIMLIITLTFPYDDVLKKGKNNEKNNRPE